MRMVIYTTAMTAAIARNDAERIALVRRLHADLPILLARSIAVREVIDHQATEVEYWAARPADLGADGHAASAREKPWQPAEPLPDWAAVVMIRFTVYIAREPAPRPHLEVL